MSGKYFAPSFKLFFRRLYRMATQPIFVALTIFGNFVIIGSALMLYRIEYGINPHIQSPLDTLWWSVATVTTVGYGDITPMTDAGKVLGICTIIVGAALFWSYTALFAEALLSKDISDFESHLRTFSRSLRGFKESEAGQKDEIQALIKSIKEDLDNHLKK